VLAIAKIESNLGNDSKAYTPNSVGAIGPMQILSKQLGAKYGNFEQYAEPGMTDPLNPVHSAVAGIKMFADLVKNNGLEDGVNAYFTGSPKPNPNATDGITTAANYLRQFKNALTQVNSASAGAGRGFVNPPMINGILPGENGGMPTDVLQAANQSATAPAPTGATAVAGQPATPSSKFDVPSLLQSALDGIKALAAANSKSMGTFGMNDNDPNSAVVAGGNNTADNIKALVDIFNRNNARFSGPTWEAQSPMERLVSGLFGGARDKMDYDRIMGQIQAMQTAVGGNQKLAQNQQTLNDAANPGLAQLAHVAALAQSVDVNNAYKQQELQLQQLRQLLQQQHIDLQQQDVQRRLQQFQQVVEANAGADNLLQDAATKLGMTIPQGIKPSEWAKVIDKDTLGMLQAVAAGGSLGANPVDAMATANNPALPQATREALAPNVAVINQLRQSNDYRTAAAKQKFSLDPKQRAIEEQRFFGNYVAQKYSEMALGKAPQGITNPYALTPGAIDLINKQNPGAVPPAIANLPTASLTDANIISALANSSKQPAIDISNYYKSLVDANNKMRRFDLIGAPQQKGYVVRFGANAFDLTNPADVVKAVGAVQAVNKTAQESPGVFAKLAEIFGSKPSSNPPPVSGTPSGGPTGSW
jgi:hypothetical protein